MLNRSAAERTTFPEMLTAEHFGTFAWVILGAPQNSDLYEMAGLGFFFPEQGKFSHALNLSKCYAHFI